MTDLYTAEEVRELAARDARRHAAEMACMKARVKVLRVTLRVVLVFLKPDRDISHVIVDIGRPSLTLRQLVSRAIRDTKG